MNGNVLIPLTAQSNTVGNWATGQILVQFSAAATAGLSSGNAILQIDVILNTKTSTPPFMQVIIQAGA
jgi:hypothetical protein